MLMKFYLDLINIRDYKIVKCKNRVKHAKLERKSTL